MALELVGRPAGAGRGEPLPVPGRRGGRRGGGLRLLGADPRHARQSADLYWIVVHPEFQGRGVGAALLHAAEDWMARRRPPPRLRRDLDPPPVPPTRAFYAACGYAPRRRAADFYAPGDGKAMFLKVL